MEVPPPVDSGASTRRWRRLAFLLLTTLAIGIVYQGNDRVPADPARPLIVESSPEFQSRPLGNNLTVVSFNIHGGKGDDGQIDLDRTAALIGDCDLAALFEVHASRFSTEPNQAEALSRSLEMTSVFAATERRWWHEHFGNALLWRTSPIALHRIPLPGTRGKAFRNALLAHFPWNDETLHVLAVHVDREQDRSTHLDLIVPLFLALEAPAILLGDLNSTADDPRLKMLIEHPQIGSPLHDAAGQQGASPLPVETIDWMFTKGLTTLSAELIENDASDHPVLRVELQRFSNQTVEVEK